MADFVVTAARAPDLDDAEVQRQLARAYSLILEPGRPLRDAAGDASDGSGDQTQSTADEALAEGQEVEDAA